MDDTKHKRKQWKTWRAIERRNHNNGKTEIKNKNNSTEWQQSRGGCRFAWLRPRTFVCISKTFSIFLFVVVRSFRSAIVLMKTRCAKCRRSAFTSITIYGRAKLSCCWIRNECDDAMGKVRNKKWIGSFSFHFILAAGCARTSNCKHNNRGHTNIFTISIMIAIRPSMSRQR